MHFLTFAIKMLFIYYESYKINKQNKIKRNKQRSSKHKANQYYIIHVSSFTGIFSKYFNIVFSLNENNGQSINK